MIAAQGSRLHEPTRHQHQRHDERATANTEGNAHKLPDDVTGAWDGRAGSSTEDIGLVTRRWKEFATTHSASARGILASREDQSFAAQMILLPPNITRIA